MSSKSAMKSDRRHSMKPWRLLLAVALAAAAVLLMTSLVVAAPASTPEVRTSRVPDDPDPILTGTLPTTHPVGIAIARYFNISYTQVMSWHAQGFGFGAIARAYLTALASNGALTPEQVLAQRQAGVGWGQIKRDYGVPPGGKGLGTIMSNKHDAPQPEPAAPASPKVKPGKNASGCPGNSCAAPGLQKPPKGKPAKAPKT
jgi:hypothetical protein